MTDVEQLIKKVTKKMKDKQAKYLYGYEFSSDSTPSYKAMIRFSKDGVPAVVFAAKTKRELKKQITEYLMGAEAKDINIRYHEAQIELEQEAIRFHQKAMEEYESTYSKL